MQSYNSILDWFNSPYYSILYSHRSEVEAKEFIEKLMQYLCLPKGSKVLDVACGRGRHALMLSKMGCEVTGIDLAENKIKSALQHRSDSLDFFVHNAQKPLYINYFDLTVNLFTSFGYEATDRENIKLLNAAYLGLKKNGLFVIDYLNAYKVLKKLPESYSMTLNGIHFSIKKKLSGNDIVKIIKVNDDNKTFIFTERVKAYHLNDFERMLSSCGFVIKEIWGDYKLHPFEKENSERLLIKAIKP